EAHTGSGHSLSSRTMKPPPRDKAGSARTGRAIAHLLKQEGPMDAQQLANRLPLSPMAYHLHLYTLQAEQLVSYEEEPRPLGRPAKLWRLTSAADRLFPEGYAELALSLLSSIGNVFGKSGLERLLVIRTRDQIAAYRRRMTGQTSLAKRLKALAAI